MSFKHMDKENIAMPYFNEKIPLPPANIDKEGTYTANGGVQRKKRETLDVRRNLTLDSPSPIYQPPFVLRDKRVSSIHK